MLVWVNEYKSWDVTEDVKVSRSAGKLTEVLKFESKEDYGDFTFQSKEGSRKPYLMVTYYRPPIYRVNLESVQDTGVTSNVGSITIADERCFLPLEILAKPGSYPVTYDSGYVFVRWETSGGISVSDTDSPSTTVTVSGDGVLRAVGNAKTIKYFYDDGVYTVSTRGKSKGDVFLVRFTPLFSGKIKEVTYYFTYLSYEKPENEFKVRVMDSSMSDLITPFVQTPESKGWLEVDLSPYNIQVHSGVDFYVGIEFLGSYPNLGADRSAPDGRSLYWDKYSKEWKVVKDADYRIRAVVESIEEAPKPSLTPLPTPIATPAPSPTGTPTPTVPPTHVSTPIPTPTITPPTPMPTRTPQTSIPTITATPKPTSVPTPKPSLYAEYQTWINILLLLTIVAIVAYMLGRRKR